MVVRVSDVVWCGSPVGSAVGVEVGECVLRGVEAGGVCGRSDCGVSEGSAVERVCAGLAMAVVAAGVGETEVWSSERGIEGSGID